MFGLVFQRALVKQVDYLIKNFKEEKGKNYTEYLASFPGCVQQLQPCHKHIASVCIPVNFSAYSLPLLHGYFKAGSEPEFYGDLVYKFRKIIGKNDFPYHFKRIIVRYKKIGYNIDVLR